MKKSWWTPDRIAMLIGLGVTIFGWGVTWGILSTRVNHQEETISELKAYKVEAERKDEAQEIKINSNADAIAYSRELFRYLVGEPGPEEGD